MTANTESPEKHPSTGNPDQQHPSIEGNAAATTASLQSSPEKGELPSEPHPSATPFLHAVQAEKPLPGTEEFDEEELFCRMTANENIFNSRGLSKAPKADDDGRAHYRQMGCCAQMHSYQWTNLFPSMSAESNFPIVQVRFKNTHKDFFRLPENTAGKEFRTGDIVIVESSNGHDTGTICLKGELVRLQLKKRGLKADSPQIRKVIRKARQSDIDKWIETMQAEKEMQRKARVIAAQLGLSMKINNVEIQGDFTKAIFYYTADDRVDFRQLIKLYAEEFKLRIEMRQIGARQESGILGGIGACGRELCCVTFLHNFTSVSTHAARIQQVSLNPQKLAGQCSKLKCCLNYEYDVYMDALKSMPDSKIVLKTEKGDARCIKTDPLKQTLTYAYHDAPGVFIELKADQVFDLIERNKQGEIAGDLNDYRKDAAPKSEPEAEFQQVVGQDDVTRFDKPKENRKKNKDRKKGQKKEDGNNARQRTQPSLPDAAKPKPQAANKAKGGGSNKKNKPQRTARPLQKPILKTNPQE